jgi:hypothetical protein
MNINCEFFLAMAGFYGSALARARQSWAGADAPRYHHSIKTTVRAHALLKLGLRQALNFFPARLQYAEADGAKSAEAGRFCASVERRTPLEYPIQLCDKNFLKGKLLEVTGKEVNQPWGKNSFRCQP